MNDVVADLTLKPTILEIDRFFSEQDVTTAKEYEKPKKVLKVKPAAAPLYLLLTMSHVLKRCYQRAEGSGKTKIR